MQVQRLRSCVSRKRSDKDKLNRRDLANRHFRWPTEFNIVDLFVLFLRGFPRGSEEEGVTRRRPERPQLRRVLPSRSIHHAVLRTGSLLARGITAGGQAGYK
jgi:hypothetical protein